jgi:hypothetical protein
MEWESKIKNILALIGGTIVALLILCWFVSWGDDKADQYAGLGKYKVSSLDPNEAVYPCYAASLYQEYDANEIAADIKYKNKVLIVHGNVIEIGKDFIGNSWV